MNSKLIIFTDNIVDSLRQYITKLTGLFTNNFVCVKKTSVRYLVFTKNISQVFFPIVQFSKRHTFPNVRLGLLRRRRLQKGRSSESRTGCGCQALRLGHIWEVSAQENTHRKFSHGKVPNLVRLLLCVGSRTSSGAVGFNLWHRLSTPSGKLFYILCKRIKFLQQVKMFKSLYLCSLQRNGENLLYFKLRLFDQPEFIV